MRLKPSLLCGLALLFNQPSFAAQPAPVDLSTDAKKVSYSIGVNLGRQFSQQTLEINTDVLVRGIQDVLNNRDTALTDDQMNQVIADLQKKQIERYQEKQKGLAQTNLKISEVFLAENQKRAGIKTLASGLQYRVIKNGEGHSPGPEDYVSVNYKGTLVDGTEFDSSYKRGQPTTFQVNGVISGWSEALQLMKPGDKWELFVPPNLAYGERGTSSVIGPNAALIFEVELISVKPKQASMELQNHRKG